MDTSTNPRIVVVGSSCAGKSTFAELLCDARGCARIELDELYWSGGWKPKPLEEFLRLVDDASSVNSWVAAGNYSPAREILWTRATTIVWLDLGLPRVFWRGLKRSLRRGLLGERVFHDNAETLRRTFFSRESILWWILTTFSRRRREFSALRESRDFEHLTWLHARTPDQAQAILKSLAQVNDRALGESV